MSNEEIIYKIAEEIYGEDALISLLEKGHEIPLHTLKGWEIRHFRVREGEHGIETRLWKRKKRKNDVPDEDTSGQAPEGRDFYLAKAFLFREDQVEPIST